MRTTEEKNRMIAEFMGYSPETMNVNVVRPDGYTRAKNVTAYQIEPKRHDDLPNLTADYMLKYHTSWDWLMPVIQKIYNYSVNLDSNKQFRMSHIIENFQMAVITMTPTQGHRFVCDAIELLNENK